MAGFYIIAYDIAEQSRRAAAFRLIRPHALIAQKSVFECLLTEQELKMLFEALDEVIDPDTDSLLVIPALRETTRRLTPEIEPIHQLLRIE